MTWLTEWIVWANRIKRNNFFPSHSSRCSTVRTGVDKIRTKIHFSVERSIFFSEEKYMPKNTNCTYTYTTMEQDILRFHTQFLFFIAFITWEFLNEKKSAFFTLIRTHFLAGVSNRKRKKKIRPRRLQKIRHGKVGTFAFKHVSLCR